MSPFKNACFLTIDRKPRGKGRKGGTGKSWWRHFNKDILYQTTLFSEKTKIFGGLPVTKKYKA